jgi:hypothetical protein
MGKGTIGINPFYHDGTIMSHGAMAGLLSVIISFTDAKSCKFCFFLPVSFLLLSSPLLSIAFSSAFCLLDLGFWLLATAFGLAERAGNGRFNAWGYLGYWYHTYLTEACLIPTSVSYTTSSSFASLPHFIPPLSHDPHLMQGTSPVCLPTLARFSRTARYSDTLSSFSSLQPLSLAPLVRVLTIQSF